MTKIYSKIRQYYQYCKENIYKTQKMTQKVLTLSLNYAILCC